MTGTASAQAFDAIIGLGSNIGDKRAHIAEAIKLLTSQGDVQLVKRSCDYRSAPWGNTDQDWFVNACVSVATELGPLDLLHRCLETENQLKRVRTQHWGPRTIDCDLLVYRDIDVTTPELTLPHPRITERAFVLVPLQEIAPQTRINGKRAGHWLKSLDASDIVAIKA